MSTLLQTIAAKPLLTAVLLSTSAAGMAQSGPYLPNFNFTQEGEQIGSAPSMAVYNGVLFIAFKSDNSSHTLFLDSTADGVNLTGAREFAGIKVGSTPTLAVFNGKLFIAFAAENGQSGDFVCSTTDIQNFNCAQSNFSSSSNTPAMAVYNGRLYLANETNNVLAHTSTADGVNFAPVTTFGEYADQPPALATLNGSLLLSFSSNDPSHDLWLQEGTPGSNAGINWGPAYEYPTRLGGTPALATETGPAGQTAILAFQANDSSHHLWYASITGSYQGQQFIRQDNAQIGSSPAEVIFTPSTGPFANQETLFVAFQANNSSHRLWFGGQTVNSFSATQ